MRALVIGAFCTQSRLPRLRLSRSRARHSSLRARHGGDNFGISFAGVALIAYMSSLTNLDTPQRSIALEFNLCLAGKDLEGISGAAVEA